MGLCGPSHGFINVTEGFCGHSDDKQRQDKQGHGSRETAELMRPHD
jgi:hypothetical protein